MTLVYQRVLDRSTKSLKLSVVGDTVVLANGQPLDIRGRCDLLICNNEVNVVHSVLIAADVTQDCLLGIDFLGKYGCKIDFDRVKKVFEISLAETVVVPGRHEIVC